MTTLKNKRLYDLELDESGTSIINEEQYFYNWWGRLRDILIGANGEIYLATSGSNWSNTEPFTHGIIKIWNPDYVTITDKNENKPFSIFPNPAKDKLQVSVSQILLGKQMMIYSNTGKLVLQQKVDSISITIPLQNFEAGMYILSIGENGKNIFSEKFFILKD